MSEIFINKDLIKIKELPETYGSYAYLLENHSSQIDDMCEFLNSSDKLLLLNGFKGTGKTYLVKFLQNYKSEKLLTFNYMCLETTILDDMLLSFFKDFRRYTLTGIISPIKTKVDNFHQKITSYFDNIKSPMLIVLDSFNSILKENKADIISFINHLQNYDNIKVIIISRSNIESEFQEIKHSNISTQALDQKIFEKLLRANDIKQIGVLSNELYKLTKGYFDKVLRSINIIKQEQLQLGTFLEIYSKSYMPFNEFIIRECINFIDPMSLHLFRLLTVLRIPVPIKLLTKLHLYDEYKIQFFIANNMLTILDSGLYLEDSFRDVIEPQIQQNVLTKIRKSCVELYEMQLPLKPMERDLNLSRQTIRHEIEYHNLFIPKKYVPPTQPVEETTKQEETPQIENKTTEQETAEIAEHPKEEKISHLNFVIEDENILDGIATSIENFISTKNENENIINEAVGKSLSQIINEARNEEKKYNFKNAIILYQNALTKTNDDDFYTFLPTIYTKLAQIYKAISDLYESLNYYTQALDFYENTSNTIKIYETKLEMAEIYYAMFKYDNAKYILSELRKAIGLPNELAIRVYLASAKLSNISAEKYNFYQKALPFISIEVKKSYCAQLYYEYAVLCDEKDDLKLAAEYYKKCIEIEEDNPYLTKALLNMAELYEELDSEEMALKYYNDSYNVSIDTKNYNGIYCAGIRLAEIYENTDEEKYLHYIHTSIKSAEALNEPYYIMSSMLSLGDYYLSKKRNDLAYKYYIKAYNSSIDITDKENLNKILLRISDLRKLLTTTQLIELQGKYGTERFL